MPALGSPLDNGMSRGLGSAGSHRSTRGFGVDRVTLEASVAVWPTRPLRPGESRVSASARTLSGNLRMLGTITALGELMAGETAVRVVVGACVALLSFAACSGD